MKVIQLTRQCARQEQRQTPMAICKKRQAEKRRGQGGGGEYKIHPISSGRSGGERKRRGREQERKRENCTIDF